MMKPRALVPFISLVPSTPTYEQTIHELQTELRRTQNKLTEESYKRAQAEALVAVLKRNQNKPPVVPRGDMDDGYDCPNCQREITDDFRFCPDCGCEIDWTGWSLPEPTRKPKLDAGDIKALKAWTARRSAV